MGLPSVLTHIPLLTAGLFFLIRDEPALHLYCSPGNRADEELKCETWCESL